MTGQRRVSRMDLAFASLEDQRGDGPGIIPPDLPGHAAEELEGGDHPFEDGLGPLERQGQDERGVGVGPGGDEERDGPAALGEVDVDVAEIGFEAMSREMPEGDEGLAISPPVLEHVALDLGIAAGVGVLLAEATMDLCGGMPLLGRSVLVVGKDRSMIGSTGPRSGALRSRVRATGGSAWLRTYRTVLRVCPNCREICRMDMPSRRARRIAP